MDKKDLAKKLITEFAKWGEKAFVEESKKQDAKRKRNDVYVPGEFGPPTKRKWYETTVTEPKSPFLGPFANEFRKYAKSQATPQNKGRKQPRPKKNHLYVLELL